MLLMDWADMETDSPKHDNSHKVSTHKNGLPDGVGGPGHVQRLLLLVLLGSLHGGRGLRPGVQGGAAVGGGTRGVGGAWGVVRTRRGIRARGVVRAGGRLQLTSSNLS